MDLPPELMGEAAVADLRDIRFRKKGMTSIVQRLLRHAKHGAVETLRLGMGVKQEYIHGCLRQID
jgi:hypothetical protein